MGRRNGNNASTSAPASDPGAGVIIQDQLVLEIIGGPGMHPTDSSRNRLEKQYKRITVGRTTRGTNFTIKDGAVSEQHAVIEWTGEGWMLTDVGSSNGTSLNGVELEEGKAVRLRDGDRVLFGTDSLVRVEVKPVDAAAGTVSQYLDAVVDGLAKKILVRASEQCARVRAEAAQLKEELRAKYLQGDQGAGAGGLPTAGVIQG